jgi:CubicO group peptidase (beta-lactamase class C family)
MRQILSRRTLAYTFAGLAAILLLILAVWVAIAGLTTVTRVVRYGDTGIDDFQVYPFRQLDASPSPFSFTAETGSARVPAEVTVEDGEPVPLDNLLAANDSIAFLVIKDDAILYERYFQGHSPTSISQAFSVSKSFLATLIGAALHDGILQSVDQPVSDYLPELSASGFDRVTLRHLLTMTSGSDYIENDNPFGIHVILNYTPNWPAELLSVRVKDEPGKVFRYKSGDNALLALILDQALGPETISAYTQRVIWTPLGMERAGLWSLDQEGGMEKTWCCLAATARDFAKLGRLYLGDGEWNGQRILAQDWTEEAAQVGAIPATDWPQDFHGIGLWNYGYQWWLVSKEEGDFLALGKDGQYLYVNPTTNLIILRLGRSQGELPTSQWITLFKQLSHEAR